jgi:hypothetical protein
MTNKYDPRIHELNIKSLYENETMKKEFLKHLEKEYNSEAFLFYFEIKKYIELKKLEDQKNEFKRIYLLYFQKAKEGEKLLELNVPAKTKLKMKKMFDEIDQKSNLDKEILYLLKISKTVNQELELDSVNK